MSKKILVVGNFNWYFYEEALIDGFKTINVETCKFKLETFDLKRKVFNFAELIRENNNLINFVNEKRPDSILFYRTNEVFPSSLKKIRKSNPFIKLLFFHNDNPFFGFKNKIRYFIYLKCLKYTDLTYVYRPSNLLDAKKYGAKNVKLFYPYYCSKIHLIPPVSFNNKTLDVVFIGHYEKKRAFYLDFLIKNKINVKIYGGSQWLNVANKMKWPDETVNGVLNGTDYSDVISKSKIALCFLSKFNNDVYTRRNFEIPATGTLVLSEYSSELSNLFIVDKEIVCFRDKIELLKKANEILINPKIVESIALAGQKKVVNGGNSEFSRAKQIIDDLKELE